MCRVIDILKYASRALKNDLYRCGTRVADRNVISHSSTNNIVENPATTKRASSRLRYSLLLFFTLLMGMFSSVYAGEFCVANPQFNGVIDGTVTYTSPPMNTITQITIDGDCAFKNFTAANPLNVTINYQTNDDSIYLITFDNVVFTGNMACAAIDHKLWVVNSPEGAFSSQCQDIIIPAETIKKEVSTTSPGIGEPFTYTLTLPSMEFPVGDPSPNDLGNIILTDDLNAMGVDITLVGTPTVNYVAGGAVPHIFTNTAGLLSFDLPNIPSGTQIEIQITAVLDNTAGNIIGTEFFNTAEWKFSRAIDLDENGIIEDGTVDLDGDGIIEDEFFDPLPGENGLSPIMRIVEPVLTVTKTSSETAVNLGIPVEFTIDVQNTGDTSAWNAKILDRLPNIDAPDPDPVGICDLDPTLSVDPTTRIKAQIFEADGTTPVGGELVRGTDYSVTYTGAATCELSFSMLTSAAVIGPTERLILKYTTELDLDTTRAGYDLINVAGATEWFSADSGGAYPARISSRVLTDGTPATADHEDSNIVTTALSGYFFQKIVENLTTATNPATTAAPGDTLRYRLRLFNVDQTFTTININDVIDPTRFDLTSFTIVSLAAGSTASPINLVTGEFNIFGNGGPLNLIPALPGDPPAELVFEFDITLLSDAFLNDGDIASNQATLTADGPVTFNSDDPFELGISAPGDPVQTTSVVIRTPGPLTKINPNLNTQTTATIGEQFTYRVTIPATTVDVPLYDVRILDDLTASTADMSFVSASVVSGGTWSLSNTGTSTFPVIEDTISGIDIPANGQAVIDITVELQNTAQNNAGLDFSNTASYTYNRTNGVITSQKVGAAGSTTNMTVIEPGLATFIKTVDNNTPTAGDVIRYSVTLEASSGADFSDVFDVTITDSLSAGLVYEGNPTVTVGAGISADNFIDIPVITGDGSVATPQTLVWSPFNANADIDIAEGETITISYDVRLLDSVLANQVLTNSVIAQWTSIDGANAVERDGSDGIAGLNDYITDPAAVATVTTPDINATINKIRLNDTYVAADDNVRIGDIVEYELRITIPEGTLGNLQLVDTLPRGLDFEGVVSINGNVGPAPYVAVAPFNHADIAAANITELGDPTVGSTTVTFDLGNVTNQPIDGLSNDFVIVYRARVLNNVFLETDLTIPLNNTVVMTYDKSAVTVTESDIDTVITALQPALIVNKLVAPLGGDLVVNAYELVNYTVEITNNGTAPAYDVVLQDTIPVGMRNGVATVTVVPNGTEIEDGGTGVITTLADPTITSYVAATGILIFDLDTGVADTYTILPGDILRITYQVQVDAVIAGGQTLTNAAQVTNYYSFDDDAIPPQSILAGRESYNATTIATTTVYTGALPSKALLSPAQATIGEEVVYQITVPGTLSTSPLYDIEITDTLDTNLEFVSATITGGGIGITDNSTTAPGVLNVLVDEIPAGQQVVIELRAIVQDIPAAVDGVAVDNTVSYTYAYTDGGVTEAALNSVDVVTVTLVEPGITLEKTGPPTMRLGNLETFTLNIHNTGNSAAWDLTITDVLPNPAPGGMCDATPNILTAGIYLANGTTLVTALNEGPDYSVNYTGAPACTLTLTMTSTNAAVPVDNRLIVTYETQLDADNVQGVTLTNLAGVTEWFSLDTVGAGATGETRTYTRTLTDIVTAAAVLDHEDSHELDTEVAIVQILKSVINVTTTQNPGTDASPGDRLRYIIRLENVSPVELTNFSFVDELDALNAIPAFAAGTLTLDMATIPAGADVSNTNDSGGTNGTGLVDIRNLNLGADGTATEILEFAFEIDLTPSINSGTVVLNQGQASATNLNLVTDDPNISGAEDPNVAGDEQPTETLITSAPVFEVFKTSTDLTGDANILLAGDTLRYTISVKNIGTENAINTILSDQLPANTTYVAGSTRLNGNAVTEPTPGTLPLQTGILINAPEDTTAGAMRADATATTANVATITFDVTINSSVVNGTIISNQAYISASGASGSAIADTPSDDPATATLDDPTRDVIGDQPLVDVLKTVTIRTDNNGNGELDPGDILRYTITISNIGAADATGVTFIDAVPANTTYAENTVTLNTLPVGQPDAGVSPLIAGIDVSSSDLTSVSGLPTPGNGTVTAGQSAVITFDVEVNAGVASGTVISNQGNVYSNELPVEATDADGIDSNGDQPTLIVVGNAQLLSIIKTVSVVGGGPALAGGQLEYRILVTNISSVAATNVIITDDLDLPVAGQLTYVAGSGFLNGSATGVSFLDPVVTADYSTSYGNLLTGQSAELVFRVTLENTLAIGTTITNTGVVYWNALTQTANSTISIDVGGTPGVANVNGKVWHDANFNNIPDAGENELSGWNVDIYRNTTLLGTVTTDANGNYSINGLIPNYIGTDRYDIRFRAPGSNATTAKLGLADSLPALGYINALHRIYDIVLNSGENVQNLNLPIDPNGVVYNSVIRTAIPGATISLLNAGTGVELSSGCFDDINQQNQVTTTNGYYKFDLNFSQADCIAGGDYLIRITPPATGYSLLPSAVIAPQTDASTAAFDVPACAGDAVATPAGYCEVLVSELAPTLAVVPASATYYLHITLSDATIPGDSQIFNNHLPIDPVLTSAVSITKTSALVNVTRGKLIPYTITVRNGLPVILSNSNVIDTYPAGFKYVEGSARLNGVANEPTQSGLRLIWSNIDLIPNETQTIKLLLIVGAAVNEGEYINQAQVIDTVTNTAASEIATATVRVVSDPDFDCSDVIGKVFDDKNLNGYQDENEKGLAGVKLVTLRGLVTSSDKYGRFHVTCAVSPNESRGSNFLIKLDERSLPSGYRMTTENPRVQRATRGKMLKFNFGSTVHRVVSMDLADGVFVANSTEIHKQWLPRIDLLIKQLQQKPSVLRLSYLADVDNASLVDDRMEKVKQDIVEKWLIQNKYKLTVETEVFWRRGGPPNRGDID